MQFNETQGYFFQSNNDYEQFQDHNVLVFYYIPCVVSWRHEMLFHLALLIIVSFSVTEKRCSYHICILLSRSTLCHFLRGLPYVCLLFYISVMSIYHFFASNIVWVFCLLSVFHLRYLFFVYSLYLTGVQARYVWAQICVDFNIRSESG